MTGTGTQENPYIVENANEFNSVCQNANVYIKLANDIEFCGENGMKYFVTVLFDNLHVDLNGYAMKKIRVTAGDSVLRSKNGRASIRNGVITDIFAESARTLFDYTDFQNVSIGINASKMSYALMSNCRCDACSIHAVNRSTSTRWFNTNVSRGYIFADCDIYVEGNVDVTMIEDELMGYGNFAQATGCRFTGKLDIGSRTEPILTEYGMDSCVIAVDMESCQNGRSLGEGYGYFNIVDKTIIGDVTLGGIFKGTFDIYDPDLNNEYGFAVEVVG